MRDWLSNSLLYEINTWVWLREWSLAMGRPISLAELPDRAWDQLADLGVRAVWLMGVWERSPAGLALARRNGALRSELRRHLPDLHADDLIGSPYCIRNYQVDPHLGGPAGLATARQALAERGIRLVLDFVPNHVAVDHPWVSAHPDWLIQGSSADLRLAGDAFVRVGGRVFVRGRDPYFPPWSDVLQLNVFNRELRRAAVSELRAIADQCDGVRCDMAMLVMNEIFARTWAVRVGPMPDRDYWPEVISAIKSSHSEFRFIAESYWNTEAALLGQGFDACYDKGLYDCLAHGSAESIREHLGRSPSSQNRLVRFLENHDELRAAHLFPWPKAVTATVILLTLPGVRLLHEGQLEGRTIRTALHISRRPAELPDSALIKRYAHLLQHCRKDIFHSGSWALCQIAGWPNNSTCRHLVSWCWRDRDERWGVVVNYSAQPAQGRIYFPWQDLAGRQWRLVESLVETVFERHGDELAGNGLFVDLEPWGFHLLQFGL